MAAYSFSKLGRAFALCAGLAVMPHAVLADDPPAPATNLPAEASRIKDTLDKHHDKYPEIDTQALAAQIQRVLFRMVRDYITTQTMPALEDDAIGGILKWIEDAPADLAKAQKALADAQKTLDDRAAARAVLGDAATPDQKAHADDAFIEARDVRDDADEAVKAVEKRIHTITVEDLLAAGLNEVFHDRDPHSNYIVHDSPLLVGSQSAKADIGINDATDGPSKYILTRGLFVRTVMDPQDESPARLATVQPGDLITTIDGVPLVHMPLRDAEKLLKGDADSTVKLGIERASGPVTLPVVRKNFGLQYVTWRIIDKVAKIKIGTYLNADTGQKVAEALKAAIAQVGGLDKLGGVVLDVRNNPGGRLDAVVQALDYLIDGEDFDRAEGAHVDPEILKRNTLIVTPHRNGTVERHTATPGSLIGDKPWAVLINGKSASAADITACVAQGYRNHVIGRPSYGKDTYQETKPLPAAAADPPVEEKLPNADSGAENATEQGQTVSVKFGESWITGGFYKCGPHEDMPQWKGITPDILAGDTLEDGSGLMEALREAGRTAPEREKDLKNALQPPADAVEQNLPYPQHVCERDENAPGADDPALIDPRTGLRDDWAACAVNAVLGRESGLGVRLSVKAQSPAPG